MDIPTYKKTAIYMRVSTEEQREQQSILTQRDFAERYTALHDIPIYGWYPDDGISGTVALHMRPQGARLLDDAKEGKINVVLVYRLDRLGRDSRLTLNAVNDLEQLGVEVRSMTEPFDTTTPAGRFTLNMLSGMAAFERDSIVERSQEGTGRAIRDGVWISGRRPFGYRTVGQKKTCRLVVSESPIEGLSFSEADIIRLMYHLCADERKSCYEIAEHLDALGIPTHATLRNQQAIPEGKDAIATSGHWLQTSVYKMLHNTLYMGIHRHGVRSKQKNCEILEQEVPAIVSVEMWERAQNMLHANMRFSSRNGKTRYYLLRGLVKCGVCGASYTGAHGSANGQLTDGRKAVAYYRCRRLKGRKSQGYRNEATCNGISLNAEKLEAKVWQEVESYIRDPQLVMRLMTERLQTQKDNAEMTRDQLAMMQQALQECQGEKDSVIKLFRKGRISERDLDRQLDTIQQEEHNIQEKIDVLYAEITSVRTAEDDIKTVGNLLSRLQARLAEPVTPDLQREILEVLIERVVIFTEENTAGKKRARVRVHYRFDAGLSAIPENVIAFRTGMGWESNYIFA